MTDEKPAAQPKQQIDLNLVQVLDLGCGIMHQAFIKQPADKAKALLKDLKGGKSVKFGAITLTPKNASGEVVEGKGHELPLKVALDYSEFVGPFGFPVFLEALKAMLSRIGQTLREKKDLNLLTNQEKGTVLVHQPGVVQMDGQYNVMVVAIEPGKNKEITLRLMFVDPNQYEQLKSDDA